MSEVQRQLVDVNERYQLLGDKLAERKFDLEGTQDKAQNYKDELRDLLAWMEQAERALKSGIPIAPTTDEAKRNLDNHMVRFNTSKCIVKWPIYGRYYC